MFKKDYSWINAYIESANSSGKALTAGAFEECKKEMEKLSEENVKLKQELRKYKRKDGKINRSVID